MSREHSSEGRGPVRDVAHTLILSAAGLIVVMVTSVVVARALGPEGRGAYAIAYRVIGLLIAFGQFGLPEAMLAQMKIARRRPSELATNALLIILVATVLSAGLLWASYPVLGDSFYKGVDPSLIWLAFLILPFSLAFTFFGRLIQLDGRLGAYNLLVQGSSATILLVVTVLLVLRPGEPKSAILGLGVASALAAVPAAVLVRRWVATTPWRIDLRLLRESLRSGLQVQWGLLAHTLSPYVGIFVLNHFLGLESIGWYAVALGLAGLILVVPQASRTVLQAWMPAAATNPGQVVERTTVFARHTAIGMGVVSLGLVAAGIPLIRLLYGVDFQPAYVPMTILLAGMWARGVGQIIVSHLALEKYFFVASSAAVLGAIVSVGLAWYLVPLVGTWGAALGTAVGHAATTALVAHQFLRKTDAHLKDFFPRMSDTGVYIRLLRLPLGRAG